MVLVWNHICSIALSNISKILTSGYPFIRKASFWGHWKWPRRYTKMTALINNTRLKKLSHMWLMILGWSDWRYVGKGEADLKGRWKIPENHGRIPSLEQTGGSNIDKSQWITRLPIKIAEDGVKEMLQAVPELWYQKNTKNEQLGQ